MGGWLMEAVVQLSMAMAGDSLRITGTNGQAPMPCHAMQAPMPWQNVAESAYGRLMVMLIRL